MHFWHYIKTHTNILLGQIKSQTQTGGHGGWQTLSLAVKVLDNFSSLAFEGKFSHKLAHIWQHLSGDV